jgi:hypothetical protein
MGHDSSVSVLLATVQQAKGSEFKSQSHQKKWGTLGSRL